LGGKRVLYPRAELARDIIPRELAAAGATVASPVAYRTVLPADNGRLRQILEAEPIDAITFTSSSTVENFLRLGGEDAPRLLTKTAVFSIGPLTTATAEEHGLTVAAEARTATLEGMIEVMTDYYKTGVRSQASGFKKTGIDG
jgi:uroporphyrinogen III methyltransferase/synthase